MAKKNTTTKDFKTLQADESIILRPRITEKTAKSSEQNCYTFDIAFGSTKSEVKKAFISIYKQVPLKINIINSKEKYLFRRGVMGKTSKTKKAYVYLPKGVSVEII